MFKGGSAAARGRRTTRPPQSHTSTAEALSGAQWSRLFHALEQATVVVDEEGRVVTLNHAARALLTSEGLTPDGQAPLGSSALGWLGGPLWLQTLDLLKRSPGAQDRRDVRYRVAGEELTLQLQITQLDTKPARYGVLVTQRPPKEEGPPERSAPCGAAGVSAARSTPRSTQELVVEVNTQVEEAAQRARQLETLGQLTGGIVHDINNLLSLIASNVELAARRARQGQEAELPLERALKACQRGAALAQRLLAFARDESAEVGPVDVSELVSGVAELLRRTLGEGVELFVDLDTSTPPVLVDSVQFETALINLILNARDAMPGGGHVVLRVGSFTPTAREAEQFGLADAVDYVVVDVEDQGTGIPLELRQQVFEPFFTTKQLGKGSGLGLSMVRNFARQSQGAVHLSSIVGEGACVSLYLPAGERSATLPSPRGD